MKHRWKGTVPLLGILFIPLPQAHAQTGAPASVTGAGAVQTSDGIYSINATLGQPAIGHLRGGRTNASQGFWHALPEAVAQSSAYEEPTTGASLLALHTSPNPFAESTRLSLQIPHAGHVSVTLYDLLGQPVRTLLDAEQSAGQFDLTLFAHDLPAGRYSLTLTTESGSQTTPLILVK